MCVEQIIIFVYDTGFCQTEADDPQKAVLYFHPNWVSDQQRLALCGQLMGAAHFCSTVFSSPRVLTLQSGKFVLRKFGQYILSVGSDQTLPEWILHERFNTLQFLFEFYHKSFENVLNSVDCNHELFSKKLSQILEIYIPILQFVVSSFGNIPTLKLPKKNSAVFLEAYQLLESCSSLDGVLGGAILHNSRIIATQFDSETTKLLALTDPYRIKTCAEQISTPFHLPVGVQILKVYLRYKVYESTTNAKTIQSSNYNSVAKKSSNEANKGSEIKRDITKIFTVHEEEDWNPNIDTSKKPDGIPTNRQKHRKSLKLKSENSSLKERSKNFRSNHNVSVCSTPTVEKTLIHEDLVSICSSAKLDQRSTSQREINQPANFIPDLVQDAIKSKKRNRILPPNYSGNRLQRMSMDDLMVDFSHKAYPVPMRYYSFGLPKLCKEVELSMKDDKNKRKLYKTRFYKTIADPMNPVFRFDGVPVSKSLYNHCLDEHYKDFITANITIDSREEFIKSKNLENEIVKLKTEKDIKSIESNLNEKLNKPDMSFSNDKENSKRERLVKMDTVVKRDKEINKSNQKLFRRSLTLPLKPLSFDGNDNSAPPPPVKSKVLNAITPSTPLMTKLSLLSLEEHQYENKPLATPIEENPRKNSVVRHPAQKNKETEDKNNENSDIITCGLFVCGQHNTTILLLLDEAAEQNPDLILSLWETSTANLEKIENLRNKSMDYLASNGSSNSYSFLSLDPQWGTMQSSGPWGSDELKVVGSLHQNLIQTQNITEVIVRNEDAVVYGYRCGGTETFYQQGGCSSVGLPTPADLMGVVTLKARRRLERDHGVVLL